MYESTVDLSELSDYQMEALEDEIKDERLKRIIFKSRDYLNKIEVGRVLIDPSDYMSGIVNPEYVRGIAEFIIDLTGDITHEDVDKVIKDLTVEK